MNVAAVKLSVPDFHMKKFGGYYKPKVLDPTAHLSLVEKMNEVSETARVPEKFIYQTRMQEFCGEAEIDWVSKYRHYRKEGVAGFVFLGLPYGLEDKMFAMAGAFLRNYIDVRILTLQEIMECLKEGSMGDYSVVMVPNFFVGATKKLPEWQVALLQGWLMDRYARSKPLVLYVSSMAELGIAYGVQFKEHIQEKFCVVTTE